VEQDTGELKHRVGKAWLKAHRFAKGTFGFREVPDSLVCGPQTTMSDHRIGLELHRLPEMMEGIVKAAFLPGDRAQGVVRLRVPGIPPQEFLKGGPRLAQPAMLEVSPRSLPDTALLTSSDACHHRILDR
jgi:hypothetical protein